MMPDPDLHAGVTSIREDRPVAVIGDIHGRSDLLERLLGQLGERPILVMGDLCDRGPDTKGVVDQLIRVGARGTIGNHDEWFVRWARGDGFDSMALSPMMGGESTLRSYGVLGRATSEVAEQASRVPAAHTEWLSRLAYAVDLEVMGQRYWMVHAGVPTDGDWNGLGIRALEDVVPTLASERPSTLVWSFVDPEEMIALDRPVIMGHRCLKEPLDLGHVIAIDTGCGTVPGGGRLTALLLPERRFITVD